MTTGLFLLNTKTSWGLFYESAAYYPSEFTDHMECVSYIRANENVNERLLKEIGNNQLVKANFETYRDIGRLFYKNC